MSAQLLEVAANPIASALAAPARGGISSRNFASLARATGAHEFNGSAKARAAPRSRHARAGIGAMGDGDWQIDPAEVRACVAALRAQAASPHSPDAGGPP